MVKYNKENPLRVFTSFSGYDSQCLALERIREYDKDFCFELVGWSEIDKYAIRAHNILFPQYKERNFGDISKIDWMQVPDFDLFTFSSPCFVAGTLVLTMDGYKAIEDVKVGDMVLSHDNQFHKVIRTGNNLSGNIYHINGMMFDGIICTGNHPFYTRERYRFNGQRLFREPKWIHAEDLNKDTYLGYAINSKSEIPVWEGSTDNRWGHRRHVNNLIDRLTSKWFWYIMGRYIGDGWRKNSKSGNSIVICCSNRNYDSLVRALHKCNFHFCEVHERTVTKLIISMNELYTFVSRYGYYAYGKRIDKSTLNLPTSLLKSFIDGYVDSDGCYTNNEFKVTSVSRELIYGIAQCVAKVYHCHVKINKFVRPKQTIIEGRTVNQRDTYTISWHTDHRKQDKAFFENGIIWFPISKILKIGKSAVVYNIEVDESHSYTANGAIVHNCQDFSQSGLQRGGEEGSGTRSSLLWECRKAILAKKPKYLMLENVKALTSKKFMPLFQKWLDGLESYGYANYWKVLNATDFGVPQNRERVFCISILKTEDEPMPVFHFPVPFPLEKRLKDIVEKNEDGSPMKVDEKYYLSDKALEYFNRVDEDKTHCHNFK